MSRRVIIVDYDPEWPELFEREKALILGAIGQFIVSVEHVGSTAVPGLAAKPIIDILIGIQRLADAAPCITPLEDIGYEYVPAYETDLPMRRYFRKGSPRTHHIHMVEINSDFWVRHRLFRDYLRLYPEAAQAYADLKRRLADLHGENREAYTEAKTDFVRGIEARAREELLGKH